MDISTDILRRFSYVKNLDKRVRGLEQRIADLMREADEAESVKGRLKEEMEQWTRFCPHGHFYSPIPSETEIAEARSRGGYGPPFPGIDLNLDEQRALLKVFEGDYSEIPFPEVSTKGWRYFLENPSYGRHDAAVLCSVIRQLKTADRGGMRIQFSGNLGHSRQSPWRAP